MRPQVGERIRVLIVDDIAETRENLRKLLSFDTDIEVVGAASSGLEGIELVKQFQPHIVLMDINMPGMDGIAATETILREVPTAQVVILSVQGETDYLRRAMLAGARDFLTKPPSGDELMSTIRRVYEMGKTRAVMTPVQPFATAAASARMQGGRREALRDMSDNMEVQDVGTFVAAIIQADQLGVSIAKVLRIQSDQMRVRRRQRAEELARQAGIKMLPAIAFLIFPAIFIVLLGPSVITMMTMDVGGFGF